MQYLSESVCVFFKMGKKILQDTSWAERGKMMDVSLSSHGDRSIIWHITSSGSAPCNPRTQWLAAGEVNFPFTRLKISIFFQAFRISVSTFLSTSVKSKKMMNVFNMGFAEAMNRRTNSFLVTSTSFPLRITFCPCRRPSMLLPVTYWVYLKPAVLRTNSCSQCSHLSGQLCCFRPKEICLSNNAHMLHIKHPGFDYSYLVCAGRDGKPQYHTARASVSTPFIKLLPPAAVMTMQNITGIRCCALRLMRGLVCSCSATWGYNIGLFILRSQA